MKDLVTKVKEKAPRTPSVEVDIPPKQPVTTSRPSIDKQMIKQKNQNALKNKSGEDSDTISEADEELYNINDSNDTYNKDNTRQNTEGDTSNVHVDIHQMSDDNNYNPAGCHDTECESINDIGVASKEMKNDELDNEVFMLPPIPDDSVGGLSVVS